MSSFHKAGPARRVGLARLALVVVAATLGTAAPTLAQEGNREIEAAMQRLHELTAQADRAREQGQHERAERLMRHAEKLEQRIHRFMREQDRAAERERGEREHAERGDRERGEREHAERGEREHAERERAEREHAELGEVLEGLKRGIWALRRIGRHEEADHLERIAQDVARELDERARGREGPDDRGERAEAERREARRQFAVVRYAVEGLVEADRHDAADLLERALHARELELQGRRDEEAMQIRERAPGREDIIELLSMAARELHEQGRGERADAVAELAQQLRHPRETDRRRDMDRRRDRDDRGDRNDRGDRDDRNDRGDRDDRRPDRMESVEDQIEIMQMAVHGLREGERKELAETIKRAIQVRQVNLRRLEGEEADFVRERAPSLGQTVEILGLASRLWREFGNDDKAEAIANLAERMWAQRERRDDDRPRRDRRRDRDDR